MWDNFEERAVNLRNLKEVQAIRDFLAQFDLTYEVEGIDYTTAFFQEQDNKIIATGSLAGGVLKNIAVTPELHGEGLTGRVVSALIREAAARNIYHYFIFTKPQAIPMFTALGFNELAAGSDAALLESGAGSIKAYCQEIKKETDHLPSGRRAALVVNCNPFTLGHQALITGAARENEGVIVMVVSEEASHFPFEVRFRLVKEGLAAYKNVAVIPGGKYTVSLTTFPSYFIKDTSKIAVAQTNLDAIIFGRYIAPALGVSVRYVGEEPYCQTTLAYNKALAEILPAYGVKVKMVPRLTKNGEIISASLVRKLLAEGNLEKVKSLVPETTYNYLISPEAGQVLEKIKSSQSRH